MIIGMVLLFGARMYTSFLQREERDNQRRMMEDLSRIQAEQRAEQHEQLMQQLNQDIADDLQKSLDRIDSLGSALELSKPVFDTTPIVTPVD